MRVGSAHIGCVRCGAGTECVHVDRSQNPLIRRAG